MDLQAFETLRSAAGTAIFTRWMLAAIVLAPALTPAERPPLEVLRQANEGLHRFVLDNGMIGLVKEDRSAPVVAIQIWVGIGSVHEEEWLGAGLSHFVEHMIFKGTPIRSPGEISREISDVGGDLNAYTGFDRTVFHVKLPSRNWTKGLEVLADAVMNASFPEEEWAREREVILREFAMHRDNPDQEIGRLLWATAFRVHPYRVPVMGYEEVFRSSTRDDLVSFFRKHYTPDNMIVSVVGDVSLGEVEARLRELFSPFQRRPVAPITLPAEPPQLAPRTERRTGPYEVTRIRMAWPTVPLSHPDAPALDVLAAITGSGRSARLQAELKERRKLAFDISAWSFTPRDPGLFGISATCDPEQEAALLAAIEEEVAGWADRPFQPQELTKARRQVLVEELSSLQEMAGQAANYAAGEFYAADPRFSERYLARVEQVDEAALQDVARRYLRPERQTRVILAPRSGTEAPSAARPTVSGQDVRKFGLPNGIRVLMRADHRLPFVHLCAVLGGGLLSEPETKSGLTRLLADLLTRGTESRSSEELARLVETCGGSLTSFSGWNSFGLQARCLAEDVDLFLELLADVLLHPALAPEELEKQRTLQLSEIRQQAEQPMFKAQQALQELLFPGHPYRLPILGTAESVAGIERRDLTEYLQQHLVAGNLVIAVFGDFDAEEVRLRVERLFASVPAGDRAVTPRAPPRPDLPARAEQREPRQQTILMLGYPGVTVRDPRCDALAVIGEMFSGLSSELGQEVRDRRGLAYYVGAYDRQGLEPGFFTLYAGVREDTVDEVRQLMQEQLARLREMGPREEELRRAVEQRVAGHLMSLQDNGGLAFSCALDELLGRGYRHVFTAEERLRALTPDDIRQVAGSILLPEREAESIVRPQPVNIKGEDTP